MKEQIIREWFLSWNDPCWNRFDDIFEDSVYYSESWGPEYFGIDEIKNWCFKWHRTCKLERWDIKQILEINDCSIVEWYFCCFDGKKRNEFEGVSLIEWGLNNKISVLKEYASKLPKYRI